ncbi:MAG: hypothetical protein KI792_07530 [Alphaproteobacteria bacterium]|nr:hypothetical protein [Alphaproteobacteria bacterium SS10]
MTRLVPIARRLHDAGHDIVLAVPNPDAAKPVLDKNFPGDRSQYRLQVIKGGHWKVKNNDPDMRKKPTHVLADVLQLFAYHDLDELERQTRIWRDLLDEHKPDLIVADFAPTLRLAHWGDVPFVMTGNGYTVPPGGRALPPIRPWQTNLHPFSRKNEAAVLMAMNEVRERLEGPPVDYVGDMLNGHRSYVCTIREFDPYRPHRQQPTLMPFNVPNITKFPTIEQRGGEKAPIFIYLPATHPMLKGILKLVSDRGVPAHVYVSSIPAEKLAPFAGKNVAIHRRPINFEDDLWKFRGIIHHAGLATAYAAIKAGTPQLLLPVNLEHTITTRGAMHLAGSLTADAKDSDMSAVGDALDRILTDRSLWQRTHEAAKAVSTRKQGDAVGEVVHGCLELIGAKAIRNTGPSPQTIQRIQEDMVMGGGADIIIDGPEKSSEAAAS